MEDGDQIVSTSYSSWIAWPATTDAGSRIASYEVRIVDSGNSGITSWVNIGTSLGYGFTGITLTDGQTYKEEVRSKDNLGNIGATTQGYGWYVVPQGWKSQAYLKTANAEANDIFGSAVAISGDTIVVGAPGEDSNQTTITNGTTARVLRRSFVRIIQIG